MMATMVEVAQRMLTKRPTVARASDGDILFAAYKPARACDPRTEMIRPNDASVDKIDISQYAPWRLVVSLTMRPVVSESVNPA